ncbi:hypothetical protein EXIGLDRAFT_820424 [Exidia glandulosa HHB12029]|uniref:Uncharacterized protein n=1 Tax=Exidia glandulosa HHB12029 TaxID=1314781 RepID=A0A165JXD0_EXIGL|nr:hypothetical protein EXIGLDRAFT_820424 [Exidia glandulosa HHB12029]
MQVDNDRSSPAADPQPSVPYFRIVYHPHSRQPDRLVPLDGSSQTLRDGIPALLGCGPRPLLSSTRPWAPFRSYADFTFAEEMVNQRQSGLYIDRHLRLIDSHWSKGGSALSFRSHRDLGLALEAARKLVVPFQSGSVTEEWNGHRLSFSFEYRDPWEWILSLVKDPALAAVSNWHAFRKFYCSDGQEERWYDHPKSATRCWDIEDTLPPPNPFPHFFAGLHVWSDKGLMNKTVKKHPVLVRATWLPVEIFSASGNGGGILLILMPIVEHPDGPDADATPDSAFGLFKMRVYQKIYAVVFDSLRVHSRIGCAITCGDIVPRVLWPGVLIVSLDGEESFYFCATKAAGANIPCSCCLCRKEDLARLTLVSKPRTTLDMRAVYMHAQTLPSKTAREAYLTTFGLHDVPQFLWEFGNSDPYQARSYDDLHFDDEGKWGKHLWPLTLERLNYLKCSKTFDQYVSHFPRWRTLRHITHPSTREYADGNWHRNLLARTLPCLVQLLPHNDCLIPCIRAYQKYCIMKGLHSASDSRLQALQSFVAKYEATCTRVSAVYGKNFNFYKQHMCAHVVPEIRATGTLNHKTTRIGEAFMQEIKQSYEATNFKSTVDHQIGERDSDMEAIARIRTTINEYDQLLDDCHDQPEDEDEATEPQLEEDDDWHLSAPDGFGRSDGSIYNCQGMSGLYKAADLMATTQLRFFKCLYVYFQSQEDYRQAHDILRCNKNFHSHPRYDCITYRTADGFLGFGRLHHIMRCQLSTKRHIDMAVVTCFTPSRWKPNTIWEDCSVYDEQTSLSFVPLADVYRGAIMCPAFGSDRPQTYYLMDDVDCDMFLRLNQL